MCRVGHKTCLRSEVYVVQRFRLLRVIWDFNNIICPFCRKSWLNRLTPNDLVLGLVVANVAVFLFWKIATQDFMLNNFTVSFLIYKFYSTYLYLQIYLPDICFICNTHLLYGFIKCFLGKLSIQLYNLYYCRCMIYYYYLWRCINVLTLFLLRIER